MNPSNSRKISANMIATVGECEYRTSLSANQSRESEYEFDYEFEC